MAAAVTERGPTKEQILANALKAAGTEVAPADPEDPRQSDMHRGGMDALFGNAESDPIFSILDDVKARAAA